MRNLAASYLLWLNLKVTSGSVLQTCHWLIYSKPYCKLLNLQSFVRVFCEVENISQKLCTKYYYDCVCLYYGISREGRGCSIAI